MADDTNPIHPLIDALARIRPKTSRTGLRELLAAGRVRVNGVVVKIARTPIAPEDRVELTEPRAEPVARLPFPVVHQDEDLLVIDKPAGLLTSTQPGEKRPTALAMVREFVARTAPRAKVGLIHRLDRDASGLLVFSLNRDAFDSLKAQFYDHSASRVYAAVVRGGVKPPEDTIRSILIEYADGTVHSTRAGNHGQDAVTHYRLIGARGDYSLLRISLETGRKHQIRAHLSERGRPIVGDTLYGGEKASRLMLAAIELELAHPRSGKKVRFESPMPEPLAKLLRE